MDAEHLVAPWRLVEHVAAPEQLVSAPLIEDDAAVDLARDLEGDARRQVALQDARDDIRRGPLRRQDDVDPDGAARAIVERLLTL